MSSRAVVTAIGIDADGDGGCALSVQAVEALKTAGSLSQQEGNATRVYTGGGQTVSAALGSFISTLGRSAYILHNQAIVVGMEQAQQQTLTTLTDYFMRNYQGRPLVDMVMAARPGRRCAAGAVCCVCGAGGAADDPAGGGGAVGGWRCVPTYSC